TTRRTGPFNDPIFLADAGLQLVLTGRKTWRRFAPFVGGAVGVAIAGRLAQDTSGYLFGTKITLAPNAGVRWYPARRISVRGDLRLVFWKLHYPLSYKVPNKFDNSSVLPAAASLDQWTAHPWATIGAGYIFLRRDFCARLRCCSRETARCTASPCSRSRSASSRRCWPAASASRWVSCWRHALFGAGGLPSPS